MVRSYEILFLGGPGGGSVYPWALYMFEGDELLDIMKFSVYNDAEEIGEKFLDGLYVSLKVCA
jgi:hypothetical protein